MIDSGGIVIRSSIGMSEQSLSRMSFAKRTLREWKWIQHRSMYTLQCNLIGIVKQTQQDATLLMNMSKNKTSVVLFSFLRFFFCEQHLF